MHCEQVKSLLNDYCEGSLSEAMRERVEAHLRGCAACQREAQFTQAIWRGLSAMPEVAPPADLHARIMTHVRANTRAREAQGRVALWRWALRARFRRDFIVPSGSPRICAISS